MIKSGSLVRFKKWKYDSLFGTDSSMRIIAIGELPTAQGCGLPECFIQEL